MANRFAGRGMLWGLGAGAAVGAAIGLQSGLPGMALGGALLGAIPGLFAGLVVGLGLALVSALSRGTAPPEPEPWEAGDRPAEPDLAENVYVQFPVRGLGTDADLALRTRLERLLDAELRATGGGWCGGGDMGSGKATVFLEVRDPDGSVPRLLGALRREGLLADRLVVAEDTGRGYRVWWPAGYRGTFALL